MSGASRRVLTAAAAAVAIAGASVSTQQLPTFRAGTNMVLVDAYPLLNGKIIEGLTPDDFEVTEDGKPQTIGAFEFLRIEPSPVETHRDPNTIDESRQLAGDPHNRVFVTFLDLHHVRLDGSFYSRRPLIDTLNRILAPNDLFGVATPRMRGEDITLARKTDTVEAELSKYWSWGRRGSAKIVPEGRLRQACYIPPPPESHDIADWSPIRAVSLETVERSWEEQSLQALADLTAYLGKIREARSSIVILSDGWRIFEPNQALANLAGAPDYPGAQPASRVPGIGVGPTGEMMLGGGSSTYSLDEASCTQEMIRLANLDDRQLMRDLISLAQRNNVTFYSVNPEGLVVSDSLMSDAPPPIGSKPNIPSGLDPAMDDADRVVRRTDSLIALSNNTSGVAVVNTNDLSAGLKKVVDEVSAYYLIGYASTNSKMDGGYRKIDVKVKRPGVKVVARRGYVASARIDRGTGAAGAAGAPSGLAGALAALGRLRPEADLFVTGAVRGTDLIVTGELAYREVAHTLGSGGTATAIVTGGDGATSAPVTVPMPAGSRTAVLRVPIGADAKGPWRVRVDVKGSGGAVDEAADLAALAGTLMGQAAIFRGTPSARSALVPVGNPTFQRTERVHVEWPLLKALDNRDARLLGRNGVPLAVAVTVTERPQDGLTILAADVVLAPLAPGDYVVDLSASAGGATEHQLVAFRVQ